MTHLDDTSAVHILKTIAQARLRSDVPDLTPAFRTALTAKFGATPEPSSEGELALAALALLAEDPAFAEPIQVMARQPVPTSGQRYIDPTSIALTPPRFSCCKRESPSKEPQAGSGPSSSTRSRRATAP